MSDRTEEFLRRGLSARKRPHPSADLVSTILKAAQAHEDAGRERAFARRFHLLRAYWAIAAVVSIWILWSASWPAWYASSLSAQAAWLIPICGAALLWSARLMSWMSALLGGPRS